jgi:hypothetical protein
VTWKFGRAELAVIVVIAIAVATLLALNAAGAFRRPTSANFCSSCNDKKAGSPTTRDD